MPGSQPTLGRRRINYVCSDGGGLLLDRRSLVRGVRLSLIHAYGAAGPFPWLPPLSPPGKAFAPGFCIPALANQGAPNAIGPRSIFQVQPTPFLGNCDPTRAATAHPGGIQVGLVDGSVRTLAPSLTGDTWAAAVTRAGGEVMGSDW